MEKWKCRKCGYVYDPEKGAPGYKAGLEFEELKESFKCPTCKASKSMFRKMRS
ncbi:rubredoxin [uncultured Methanobrevibacter sp.]|uniref:rubredoxin n=1 Tax=uncultured Methanobrevibacter sp. TaxID=253161 RepID=UPI0015BDD598|nr:rubredoxin [uncultured Methanobrevibacter sp.]